MAQRSLTVLGCDGSWPGPGGAGSGYLVSADGHAFMLDAGPGTFANLQRWGDPAQVNAVVLTHEHPDHWSDLESFGVWAGYGPGQPTFRDAGSSPLAVYAPPGLRACLVAFGRRPMAWHELVPSMVLDVGTMRLRVVATDHSVPTLAVHVAHQGASLAYSADTGTEWSVQELGDDIGLFLCEATYTAASEGQLQHLSGRQAGTMARAAGVGRLILTHRWPTVSADDVRREAEVAFGRPVEQATVGAVFAW